MRYLKVIFEDAALFRNNKMTKDFILLSRNNGICSRLEKQKENFEEPLTVFQISNLIHVLFGERPVPTFRKVFYQPFDYYFEKAKNSLLYIDSYKKYNKNKEKFEFTNETLSTKKAVYNSYSKKVDINWFLIKKFLRAKDGSNTLFNEFVFDCDKAFNLKVLNIPFYELRNLFLNNNYNTSNIIDKLSINKKTALSNYLTNKEKTGSEITTNYTNGVIRTYNNGLDKITVLSGEILIPIDNDDIKIITKKSNGISTILDGGLVYIHSILEDYEIDDKHKYNKVGEISLNKISI